MSAGQTVDRAYKHMQGVVGAMTLALEAKRPIPRDHIEEWVKRLRRAADELETLLKGSKR